MYHWVHYNKGVVMPIKIVTDEELNQLIERYSNKNMIGGEKETSAFLELKQRRVSDYLDLGKPSVCKCVEIG